MNNFVWQCRTKVYFGEGCVKEHLPKILEGYGDTVMIAYGGGSIKRNGVFDDVAGVLEAAGKKIVEFGGIMSNPTYAKALEGIKVARENNVDLILAVGGGSTMDCAKAIAIGAVYDGDIWDSFWEGDRHMDDFDPLPLGVVVTMPATGSEVNGCAVLTNEERGIKRDRDYPKNNPLFALMDPKYTLTMPKRQMLAGTFDILSHIMETYFSWPIEDNVSDDISEALMKGVIRDLRAAVKDPMDMNARSNIMWEASQAENRTIKMGKTLDFEVHNMEHQLSAFTNCNHGEGLAILHPNYYRHICKDGLGKFVKFAVNVWGLNPADYADEEALAMAGIDALEAFIKEVGLPTKLSEIGIDESVDLKMIADTCYTAGGAYRTIDLDEIYEIYCECL